MPEANDLASAFDKFSTARLQSPTLERIWQDNFRDDYAKEARPNAFYPQSVLDKIVKHGTTLPKQESGIRLLDIGCGHGLTGLYLARSMSIYLYGIDLSPASIEAAQGHAEQQDPNCDLDAKFWVADATSTGLPTSSCSVVVCLDVMLYFPEKKAALAEICRVLRPGGIFAFTTWEQTGYNPRLGASQVDDYRPLLNAADFTVKVYEGVEGARETQSGLFDSLVHHEAAVSAEVGAEVASMYAKMAQAGKAESAGRRYVFGIARKDN